MPGEKVARILRSKTDLSAEQIATLSDADGWHIIYSQSNRRLKDTRLQVCITGFSSSRKAELKEAPSSAGFRVVTGVTKNLEFLCVGENPGPSKLKKAQEQGVQIITEQQMLMLLDTGELPDES
jgi:NAD-dependent DNA ligase